MLIGNHGHIGGNELVKEAKMQKDKLKYMDHEIPSMPPSDDPLGNDRHSRVILLPNDTSLDEGIAPYVELLIKNRIETYAGCQGGKGHAYPVPTIRFHGQRDEGFRALAIVQQHGLPVRTLRRIWEIKDGEPTGPHWEMVFDDFSGPDMPLNDGSRDPRMPHDEYLDEGIAPYVDLLIANRIETYESCQGGKGHSYPEPAIRFFGYHSEGFRALALVLQYALPVKALRRIWNIIDDEPTGPDWEIVFWEPRGSMERSQQ